MYCQQITSDQNLKKGGNSCRFFNEYFTNKKNSLLQYCEFEMTSWRFTILPWKTWTFKCTSRENSCHNNYVTVKNARRLWVRRLSARCRAPPVARRQRISKSALEFPKAARTYSASLNHSPVRNASARKIGAERLPAAIIPTLW